MSFKEFLRALGRDFSPPAKQVTIKTNIKMKENLGKIGTDKITGFTGVITATATYLTGCDQLCIQPKCGKKSDAYPSANWFDEGRVIISEQELIQDDVSGDKNGCDHSAPIK